jgi:hypothetical protein
MENRRLPTCTDLVVRLRYRLVCISIRACGVAVVECLPVESNLGSQAGDFLVIIVIDVGNHGIGPLHACQLKAPRL